MNTLAKAAASKDATFMTTTRSTSRLSFKLPDWLRAGVGKRVAAQTSRAQPRKLTPIAEVMASAGRDTQEAP
ncbi:MAG: hypothetical protein DCF16_09180 [Alphaproteobacteria bacterium]|nr:MAG: hypothetical protein DCF16_09180 [Alphaproteobacteria bacterium]